MLKHGYTCIIDYQSQGPKKNPKAKKIARTVPKNFLNNSRAIPNKTRALRQIAQESSPESSENLCHISSLGYLYWLPKGSSQMNTSNIPLAQTHRLHQCNANVVYRHWSSRLHCRHRWHRLGAIHPRHQIDVDDAWWFKSANGRKAYIGNIDDIKWRNILHRYMEIIQWKIEGITTTLRYWWSHLGSSQT